MPENLPSINDLNKGLQEEELPSIEDLNKSLKKKVPSEAPTSISVGSDGETPSISTPKKQINQTVSPVEVLKGKTRNTFLSNPLFDNVNSREVYYNTLRKKGFTESEVKSLKDYSEDVVKKKPEFIKYSEILKKNPDDRDANYAIGNVFLSIGDNVNALSAFKRSLDGKKKEEAPTQQSAYNQGIASSDSNALYGMGYALDKLGDKDQAIALYNQALQKDPDNINAYKALAYHLHKEGDSKGSRDALKMAKDAEARKGPDQPYRIGDAPEEIKKAQYAKDISDAMESIVMGDGPVAFATNPVGSILNAGVSGVKAGWEGLSRVPSVYDSEGGTAATAVTAASLAKIGFGALTVVNPELAAFHLGTQAAGTVLPEKVMNVIMAPASEALNYYEINPSQKQKAIAELGDIVGNLLLFEGAKKGGKISKDAAVSLKEKWSKNEPLTNEEVNTISDVVNGVDPAELQSVSKDVIGLKTEEPSIAPGIKKLAEDKKKIEDDLANPEITEDAKDILREGLNEINDKIDNGVHQGTTVNVQEGEIDAHLDDVESKIKSVTENMNKAQAKDVFQKQLYDLDLQKQELLKAKENVNKTKEASSEAVLYQNKRNEFVKSKLDEITQVTGKPIDPALVNRYRQAYGDIFDRQQESAFKASGKERDIIDDAKNTAKELRSPEGEVSPEGIVEPLKTQEDAISKQGSEEVSVQPTPRDSETLGERDTKGKEVAGAQGRLQEEGKKSPSGEEAQKELDVKHNSRDYKISLDEKGDVLDVKTAQGNPVEVPTFNAIKESYESSRPTKESVSKKETGEAPPEKPVGDIKVEQLPEGGSEEKGVVKQSFFPKVGEFFQKALHGFVKAFHPASLLSRRFGKEVSGETIKKLSTPDVALYEFGEKKIKELDKSVNELEERFNKDYSAEEMRDANLAYGKPETEEGMKLQQEAIERLSKTESGKQLLEFNDKVRKEISDNVYKMAKDLGFDNLDYFEDYFYGVFKGKTDAKDMLAEKIKEERLKKETSYKTTERFTKDKSFITPADAASFGLELKDTNPISNLKKEAYAVGTRAALKSIKDDFEKESRPYAIKNEEYNPVIHKEWVKIKDPIFNGYLFHPDFARVVNNAIEVNKLGQTPAMKALRGAVVGFQAVKFFGSAFHLFNILKASIASGGSKGFKDFGKSLSKGLDKSDPMYKDYIQHGGGYHYSAESETVKTFSDAYSKAMKWAIFDNPTARALGVPIKFMMGKYNPISPAFSKAMFDEWIPSIKFLRYKADLLKFESDNGRPATASEKVSLVKRQQEFFGEMNEKIYGRKGFVTGLMRIFFMAPGYGEGNFLHQYRALKESGQLAEKAIKGMSEKDMSEFKKQWNEVGVKNAAFIANTFLTSAVMAGIGTYIMTGKAPKAPEDANDVRDLFKVKLGMKDGNGDDMYVDMLTYEKDSWMTFGNVLTGRPEKIPEESVSRLFGMESTTFKMASDLADILTNKQVYDYKGDPVYNKTDDLHDKLWKFILYEGVASEPISLSSFKQATEKGKDPITSTVESMIGLRPTTAEAIKEVKSAIQVKYNLQKAKQTEQQHLNRLYNENPEKAKEKAQEYNDKVEAQINDLLVKTYKSINKKDPTEEYINKEMSKVESGKYYITSFKGRSAKDGGTQFTIERYKSKKGGKPKRFTIKKK